MLERQVGLQKQITPVKAAKQVQDQEKKMSRGQWHDDMLGVFAQAAVVQYRQTSNIFLPFKKG